MKKLLLAGVMVLLLVSCGQNQESQDVLRVGTISGPDVILLEIAAEQAKAQYDLDIAIIAFEDYSIPNVALNDGTIDANMFQHEPYLDEFNQIRGYDLVIVGRTFIFPMAVYSNQYDRIDEIPDNAQISIPNDPSNGARALLLIESAGLISLDESKGYQVTVNDITENPHNFQFVELDAAQLPRTLTDVDASVINNNFAGEAGLSAENDSIFEESTNSPYANIVVAREDDRNDPRINQLVDALHTNEVKDMAEQLFPGAVAAW